MGTTSENVIKYLTLYVWIKPLTTCFSSHQFREAAGLYMIGKTHRDAFGLVASERVTISKHM